MRRYQVERKRKSAVGKGKTVEDAVKDALSKLGAKSEDVTTKVLEVPTSGFMGIGAKGAKVEVTLIDKSDEIAKDFLRNVLSTMGIHSLISVELDEENRNMFIKLDIENIGVLIGKHGQTLDSLQYLTSLVVNKNSDEYIRVILDINNYREKRKVTLENLAERLAEKAVRKKMNVELEPMNPYERRIIHAYLQGKEGISTYSVDEGINRHLIIEYKG